MNYVNDCLGATYALMDRLLEAPVDINDNHFNHGYVIKSIIKCGMKLLIRSQTSTGAPLKFGNG